MNALKTSLDMTELSRYVAKQLSVYFPDKDVRSEQMSIFMKTALERTRNCFSKVNSKYFIQDGVPVFYHLNTDQYAMFLYLLSNTIWIEGKDDALAAKVYYLNKALHAVDVFYEVKLPDIFLFSHPVGTVLGRAKYSNYFICSQSCTVGGNKDLEYPCIGEGVAMYAGSAIIGSSKIGANCLISIGTAVMDRDTPPNMVVFGKYPGVSYKPTSKGVIERYFLK